MTHRTWFRIVKILVGAGVGLLLVAWLGLWGTRMAVWHQHVEEFYGLPLDDGPHVFREGTTLRIVDYKFIPPHRGHWSRVVRAAWFQEMDGHYQAQESKCELTNAGALRQALARQPALDFDLTLPLLPQEADYKASRVAAVSDIHGSVRHLTKLLQAGGLIDRELNWSRGSGRLVVAGDVVDKGPSVIDVLWLLRKLEVQAAAAGGGVHVLLGNHERMLLAESHPGAGSFYHGRKYQVLARELGLPYGRLFGPDSELGNWLRTRNTVVRVNDVLFVHGGISRALLERDWPLETINAWGRRLVSEGLRNPADENTGPNLELLASYWGPYEYKGYFDLQGYMEQFDESVIAATLERYQCRLLVVGHASVRSIQFVRGGRIIAIGVKLPETDVPAAAPAGELLLLEGQAATRILADGRRIPL